MIRGALLAYLNEQTSRPLLCETLPRAAEVEVVPLPRAAGRLRWRQGPVEEGVQHRLQLPVQQLSPERLVVGGGAAGAARSAEREQAGGLKVRRHLDSELGRQAQQHSAPFLDHSAAAARSAVVAVTQR